MRYRSGKGETIAFDARFLVHLEKMKKEKGFYPSLRELVQSLEIVSKNPVKRKDASSWSYAFRSLKRLAAAGKLSPEAMEVYATKHTGVKLNEKGSNKKTTAKRQARRS